MPSLRPRAGPYPHTGGRSDAVAADAVFPRGHDDAVLVMRKARTVTETVLLLLA